MIRRRAGRDVRFGWRGRDACLLLALAAEKAAKLGLGLRIARRLLGARILPAARPFGENVLRRAQRYALEGLGLAFVAGIRVWTAVRKVPAIAGAAYSVALCWPTGQRGPFQMADHKGSRPLDVARVFQVPD